MATTVRIPTQLRSLTGGNSEVAVEGGTVKEVIDNLEKNYPGIGERLLDESGSLRRFVNVYLVDEDIRFLDGLNTSLNPGQSLSIVSAVAGG